MDTSFRPPTRDEKQYASDVMHGKRKIDSRIIIGSAIAGALLGIAVGFANAAQNDGAFDIGFTLICILACAFCLGIIAALILAAVRSIMALCSAWLPARIITIVVGALVALDFVKKAVFLILVPSSLLTDLAMSLLFLVFAVLIFSLILRAIFVFYCMVVGKDDEAIMTKSIAAKPLIQSNKRSEKK